MFPIFDKSNFGNMTKTMNQLIAADVVDAKASKAFHAKSSAAIMNPLGFHPSLADVKKALFESQGFPATSFGLPITDTTSVTTSKPICAHSMEDMCRFFRVPMPVPDTSQSIHHCDQSQTPIKTSSATGSDIIIVNHELAANTDIDPNTATCANQLVSTPPMNECQLILGAGAVDDTPPPPIIVNKLCNGLSSLQNDEHANIIIDDSVPRDDVETPLITSDVTTTSPTTNSVPVRNDCAYFSRDKSSYDAARKKRMIGLTKLFEWPSKMINVLANSTTPSSGQATPTKQAVQPVDSSSDRHAYLQSLQTVMSSVSMSTSFSGIDTPATALMMLSAGLFDELGVDSNGLDTQSVLKHTPSNLWACEWFSRSQHELLRHPHQPKHIFADINSFWLKSIGNRIEALVDQQLINTVLKRLVLTTSTVKTSGYCVKCRKECVASQLH